MESDLAFLEGLTEEELCELVLIPLLAAQGYRDIRYTHGFLEAGKDITFGYDDPLGGYLHLCATVKRYPLTGSVSSSRSMHEVYFQINQALTEPFLHPLDGR